MNKFGNYLQWNKVQKKLRKKGLNLFSLADFLREFGSSRSAAIRFLSRHEDQGDVERLKPGLYALVSDLPSLYRIANRLYQPSYISFESALSYYGFIPETVYSVTSATSKTTQDFEALGNSFVYHKIKEKAFVGYEPRPINGETILMALPEKAVADFLYFVLLGKKNMNERLATKDLEMSQLENYADIFGRPQILELLK